MLLFYKNYIIYLIHLFRNDKQQAAAEKPV